MTAFKKWYASNKAEFNLKRRERYAKDPDYQKKMQAASKQYRKTSRESKPERDPTLFTTEQACDVIGRNAQCLRVWCRKDYFPDVPKVGGVRYYTLAQVKLLSGISNLLDSYVPGKKEEFWAGFWAYIGQLKKEWGGDNND